MNASLPDVQTPDGSRAQSTNTTIDTSIIGRAAESSKCFSPCDEKQISTAVARAALAGFELARMADGTFVIAKWGLLRSLEGLAAVHAFLAQAGVQ